MTPWSQTIVFCHDFQRDILLQYKVFLNEHFNFGSAVQLESIKCWLLPTAKHVSAVLVTSFSDIQCI